MDILTEQPFMILCQGNSDTIVEYKNIDDDLPLYEQKLLEQQPAVFSKEQNEFNSAELYNKKLRSIHSNIHSYEVSKLSEMYQTQKFKTFKINQIITVAEYLQKVLKMIFSIDRQVSKLEKKIDSIISEQKFPNITEKECSRSTLIINNLFDLLMDIKISITELQTDKNSIGIAALVDDIWETLRLSLAICYVPDEIAPKVDSLYSNIPLKKMSSLGEELKNKNMVRHYLKDFEGRLFFIINLFISNLANQFSYYVTSQSFLNNPKGLAVFVIPMSMYLMFNFYNSGLTKGEIIKIDVSDSINQKYIKFYKTVDGYLKTLLENARATQEKIKLEEEFFNIQMLLDYYKKKNPMNSTTRLEEFISDPVIFEKMTAMVQKIKQPMIKSYINKQNPWDKTARVSESKDIDNSTIYFLLKLYDARPGSLPKFPQAQLTALLNLCNYASTFEKCVNEHVRRYRRGVYHISDSFENLFLPVLIS